MPKTLSADVDWRQHKKICKRALQWNHECVMGKLLLLLFFLTSANAEAPENVANALIKAIFYENTPQIHDLFQRYPALKNWNSGEPVFHPLMYYATLMQSPKVIALLVEEGVALDAANAVGVTALHLAAYHDATELCIALLKAGARRTPTNKLGQTAAEVARVRGASGCLRELQQ